MNPKPAPRPGRRQAALLNAFLPGAGLILLGRRRSGAVVLVLFVACLVAALAIFLFGYVRYFQLTLGGELLKEGTLDQIQGGFHFHWLIGLALAGLALQIVSMALFAAAKAEGKISPPPLPRR